MQQRHLDAVQPRLLAQQVAQALALAWLAEGLLQLGPGVIRRKIQA